MKAFDAEATSATWGVKAIAPTSEFQDKYRARARQGV